jgi:hypothetical protein
MGEEITNTFLMQIGGFSGVSLKDVLDRFPSPPTHKPSGGIVVQDKQW